jgi:hypothetical protein
MSDLALETLLEVVDDIFRGNSSLYLIVDGICHGLDKLWKWNVVCFGINIYE